MKNTAFKFIAGFAALLILGLGVFYGIQYYQYRKNPELQAEKYMEDLKRQYAEDTYGGSTPEETLQLFIDALKKGDIELASKYFAIEEQGKWEEKLSNIKSRGQIDTMVSDLLRPKEKKELGDTRAVFYIYNDQNQLAVAIDIGRGPNGRWKILDL